MNNINLTDPPKFNELTKNERLYVIYNEVVRHIERLKQSGRIPEGMDLNAQGITTQIIKESGWANSSLANRANNFGGLTAGSQWKGKIDTVTNDPITGKTYNYRVFDTPLEGIQAQVEFYLPDVNSRYAKHGVLKAKTPEEHFAAVQRAGYAEDPKYVSSNINLLKTTILPRLKRGSKSEGIKNWYGKIDNYNTDENFKKQVNQFDIANNEELKANIKLEESSNVPIENLPKENQSLLNSQAMAKKNNILAPSTESILGLSQYSNKLDASEKTVSPEAQNFRGNLTTVIPDEQAKADQKKQIAQLKREKQIDEFINAAPIDARTQQPVFGQGQLFGVNKKKTGGHLYPRYLENGGPGDEEIGKPTNPIDTNKGFFGMIGDAAKYSAARNMSKTELPKQGDLTDDEYLSTLNRKELSSIPFKKQMADRDVKSEKYFVEGVQKRMSDIGLERSQPGTPMKEDYDYLGIPFMYDKNSWFHNLVGNRYESPYSCQGVACAIGRKAGAVNAQDYKTSSARGTEGKPWAIETGSSTVDSADVLAGKGLYPVENIQPGDMIRSGYKTPRGTTHNTIATGNSYITYDDTVEYPAAYASEWQGGVKGYDKYTHDPKTDQAFRYLRNLPALQEEAATAKSTNEKYQDYLDKKTIAKMPAKEAGLIRQEPVKMPFVLKKQSYPNTRKGRKQEKQNNAYVEAYMNKLQKK